ncbi:hypothetical protein HK102_005278 [Quaeritorhiza haematococci]|nr:hypothetical protein HK102_005278 [Quaeritorhiza haematococci]
MKSIGIFILLSSLSTVFAIPFDNMPGSWFGFSTPALFEDQSRMAHPFVSRKHMRPHEKGEKGTVLDRIREDDRFSKFVQILEQDRGLTDDLERLDKKVTLFAPTNEAFEKTKEMFGETKKRRGLGDPKPSPEEIARYHICPEDITEDELYDGMLIESEYKPGDLEGERQRIKVSKLRGDWVLNMYVRVEESDMEAANGVVHVIDRVLIPPRRLESGMSLFPSIFSTFLWACNRAGLDQDLNQKGVTVFAPTNDAWENLGFQRLMYLFSDSGKETLKTVLQNLIGDELVYSDEMVEQKEVTIKTIGGESLCIKSESRKSKKGEDFEYRRRHGYHFGDAKHKGGEGKEKSPENYIMTVNGQSRIVATDGLGGECRLLGVPP